MPQTLQEKYNLPNSIRVIIKKDNSGGFIIKLPEFPGCISYAENIEELIPVLNDMVLTYFDVPRREAKKVEFLYVPKTVKTVATKKKVRSVHISPREDTPFTAFYA